MKRNLLYTVRNQFQLFSGALVLAFTIIIGMFTYTAYRVDYLYELSAQVDSTAILFSKMRESEQQFLLHYSDDADFFSKGEHGSLKEYNEANFRLGQILNNLSSENHDLESEQYLNDIRNHYTTYSATFSQLLSKITERGYGEYGVIGRMKREIESVYEKNNNPYISEFILILRKHEKDYLIRNEQVFFEEFLKTYESMQRYLSMDSVQHTNTNPSFYSQIENYKTFFSTLIDLNNEIGTIGKKGLVQALDTEATNLEPKLQLFIRNSLSETTENSRKPVIYIIVFVVFVAIVLFFYLNFLRRRIGKPVNSILVVSRELVAGNLQMKLPEYGVQTEIAEIGQNLNTLVENLNKKADAISGLSEGNLQVKLDLLSQSDSLGLAFNVLQNSMKLTRAEEERRILESERRKWGNEGLNKFSEILRSKSNDLKAVAYDVISNLVKYLNANQGSLFVFNNNNSDDQYLELIAAFAFDRNRYHKQKVYLKEGLTGTAAVEKETIYITDIPDDYVSITSGLGGARPKSILIVPLKVEDMLFGVVEIASFNTFEKYEIEFLERVSGNIASSLSITKINNRTALLLEEFKQQAEEMASQEEEMRQNMEELQATQEAAARRETELSGQFNAITRSNAYFELDALGRFSLVNDIYAKLMGYKPDELLYKDYAGLLFDTVADLRAKKHMWETLRKNLSVEGEFIFKSKTGEPIFFQGGYFPVPNEFNNITKVVFLGYEIGTLRKRIADMAGELETFENKTESLLMQEEFLLKQTSDLQLSVSEKQNAIQSMQILMNAFTEENCVAELDTTGKLVSINATMSRIFAIDMVSSIGKTLPELSDLFGEAAINSSIEKVLSGKTVVREKRKIGTNLVLNEQFKAIYNSDKILLGILYFATELKK
ncbi:MAG TPA: hypothetical protein DCQ31_12595 [Bacteroidales bacterium]|nr:hypothetical protein [Bacteroidales bacterium]